MTQSQMTQTTGGATDGGLGYALIKAAQAWRHAVAQALHPYGITTPQFLVLIAVHRAAARGHLPPTQRDIGDRLGMDPNTVSQVIRGLQQRELLERAPHPGDGRARALWLTPAGRDLTATCSQTVRALNSNFFGVLDTVRTAQLRASLDDLTAALDGRA